MKRIFIYALTVLALGAMLSCTNEKVQYDFEKNSGVAATFAAKSTQVPGLVAEDGGKVSIPLYRGNTKGSASVEVVVSGGEGVFTPTSNAVEFEPGKNVGYLTFTYDFEELSAKPAPMTVTIKNEADRALNAVASTSFTLVRQLTYEEVGEGYYYSDFGGEWDQPVLKAQEGDYFLLPSCWVSGVDFSFFCDGTTVDWYTTSSGYNYGSYGPLDFDIASATVALEDGQYVVTLNATYVLPDLGGYPLGAGVEVFYFPEGFEF